MSSWQVVQGCRHGPPLGGQGLVKRCRLASVLAGFSQSPGGRPHAELAESSRPGASPQHQQEVPPGQPAAGHRAAALAQLRQGGQWHFTPRLLWRSAHCLVCVFLCALLCPIGSYYVLVFCMGIHAKQFYFGIFFPGTSISTRLSQTDLFSGTAGSPDPVRAPECGSIGVDVSSGHQMGQRYRLEGGGIEKELLYTCCIFENAVASHHVD